MRKAIRRWLFAALGAMLLLAWPLFGWTKDDLGPAGILRAHRIFGRNMLVTLDADLDGNTDIRYRYAWRKPYRPGCIYGVCVRYDLGCEADTDGDGRWDFWTIQLGANAAHECVTEYRVDTDRDGKPDWTFTATGGDDFMARVKERRGW